MPNLITSDSLLRALIPNQQLTVKGELPLFDKLVPFLDSAEDWLIRHFTSAAVFDNLCADTSGDALRQYACGIVCAHAMHLAIPSLDIVVSPNGFATVGTQNLVAASKSRVDRLSESMVNMRDECIQNLLCEIRHEQAWLISSQAAFFGSSLFYDLSICDVIKSGEANARSRWSRYMELHPRLIDIEASLAEDWFSQEQMSALRYEHLRGSLSPERSSVVRFIKAQIISYLRTGSFNSRRFVDIVNFIRLRPDSFPEWHGSQTAALFSPPVFRNDKKASGYFF